MSDTATTYTVRAEGSAISYCYDSLTEALEFVRELVNTGHTVTIEAD